MPGRAALVDGHRGRLHRRQPAPQKHGVKTWKSYTCHKTTNKNPGTKENGKHKNIKPRSSAYQPQACRWAAGLYLFARSTLRKHHRCCDHDCDCACGCGSYHCHHYAQITAELVRHTICCWLQRMLLIPWIRCGWFAQSQSPNLKVRVSNPQRMVIAIVKAWETSRWVVQK